MSPWMAGAATGASVGAFTQTLTNVASGQAWHAGVTQMAAVGMAGGLVSGGISGVAGDGQRPASGQSHPSLLGTREPSQLMLTAFQTGEEDQAGSVFRQANSHFLKVQAIHLGGDPDELVQARRGHGQGRRPEQARQQSLEALSAEPLSLSQVARPEQLAAVAG